MRHLLLAAAVGGTALMTGYGTATAQVAIEFPGAGLYVGPTYYDDDDNYSNRPRYYRGYRYSEDTYRGRRQPRSDFAACGRNAYFNGDSCQPGRRP